MLDDFLIIYHIINLLIFLFLEIIAPINFFGDRYAMRGHKNKDAQWALRAHIVEAQKSARGHLN